MDRLRAREEERATKEKHIQICTLDKKHAYTPYSKNASNKTSTSDLKYALCTP